MEEPTPLDLIELGHRTNSYVDLETQEELKEKFVNQELQKLADESKNEIEITAKLLAAALDNSQKPEVVIEIPTARKRKAVSKEDSDAGSDSGEEQAGGSPVDQYDYDYLLNLPYKDLFEKAKTFPADSFLVLMKVLKQVFEGKNVNEKELAYLSKPEITLLSAFFSKKCKVSFTCNDKLLKVAELINCHKSSYKHKRNEENYKLVFKKAIKHLTRNFKKKFPEVKGDKKKLLLGFYRYYFRDDFIKLGLDREYELPRHDENKLTENFNSLIYNPKTVNPKYISMVAHSKPFVADVVKYINEEFMNDYMRSRYTKVERILDNCKDIVKLAAHSGNYKDLSEKIERNPRFKLPWYDDELTKAINGVKTYLITKCNVSPLMFKF